MKGNGMRIRYTPKDGPAVEAEIYPAAVVLYPSIGVQADGSWGIDSESVCTIKINGPDNKEARFFVTVGLDANGRPWAQVCGLRPTAESKGTAVASWLDFARRAAARIGGAE